MNRYKTVSKNLLYTVQYTQNSTTANKTDGLLHNATSWPYQKSVKLK